MTLDELIVKIGLDNLGFIKGTQGVTDALDRTKKDAVSSGKAIEESMVAAGDALTTAGRKLLGLYALFTAGRGLKEFVADVTSADAALGRMAHNMDESGRALSTWRNASEAAGGSADATAATLAKLSSEMQTAALTGTSSVIPAFRALGIGLADARGHARSLDDIMVDMNRRAQGMDPARFTAIARMAGFDDGTINLLEKSTDEFDRLRREQEKYAATAADIDAAQKRQTGFRELLITSTSLGRTILTALTPAITGAMRATQDWLNVNQAWIKSAIVEYVGQFVGWLRSVDWKQVGADLATIAGNIRDTASAFASVVRAVNGDSPLVKAFEAFGVLLAARILLPLTNITKAVGALSGIPLGGVLALLGGATYLGANTMSNVDPWRDQSAGETALRAADPGLADRVYGRRGEQLPHGPRHGLGVHAAPHDTRNLWQRTMPKFLGGRDAPTFSTDMPREARALLDTLASGEAHDYNVLNGRGTFSDFSHHPGGRAAGRYQFLPSTWRSVQAATGVQDFGPASQDKGAWWLAQHDYARRTGRDLSADLRSGDPARIAAVGQALHGTWISTNGQFASRYADFLGRSADRAQPNPQQPFATQGGLISGDISGQASYSHGQLDATKGLIFHHTGGRGTPEGVVQTLNQRGLGVQYVMDRDGKIFRTLPEGARGAHILRSEINDLNNGNTRGVEVIARDDKDVTPAQVAAGKAFAEVMARRYPGLQVFGHGEVNPSHKMASEGHSIVEAFRAGRAAPATDPNFVPAPIPMAQRTLQGYMGRDPVKVELTDRNADNLGGHIAKRTFGAYLAFAKDHVAEMPKARAAWQGAGAHHGLSVGARAWAAVSHARHMTSHSTHHEETHVGEMHVYPQTGDGRRFAGDFRDAARGRNSVVTQANYGLA